MEEPYFNFTVQHNKQFFLQNILIGDYGKYNSPLLPIYIISGDILKVDGYIEEKVHSDFLAVELYKDPDRGYREIASILVRYQTDNEIYVAIKGRWEGENRWDQVEKLVKSILQFLYDHGYTIISATPFNIIPIEMYSPKKGSEEFEKSTDKVPSLIEPLAQERKVNQSGSEGSFSSNDSAILSVKTSSLTTLNPVDPESVVHRFGRDRDLTLSEVKEIVAACKEFQHHDGTISAFYFEVLQEYTRNKFSLETLKSWVKNKKYRT